MSDNNEVNLHDSFIGTCESLGLDNFTVEINDKRFLFDAIDAIVSLGVGERSSDRKIIGLSIIERRRNYGSSAYADIRITVSREKSSKAFVIQGKGRQATGSVEATTRHESSESVSSTSTAGADVRGDSEARGIEAESSSEPGQTSPERMGEPQTSEESLDHAVKEYQAGVLEGVEADESFWEDRAQERKAKERKSRTVK